MEKEKILGRKRHKNREDLTGEHKFGDIGQVILLLIFLTIWIIDSFFLNYSTFLSKYVPLYVKIPVAIIVFSVAGWLARSGLNIVFGEVRDESIVIREGVFGLVRHPIYIGAILFHLGLLILSFSLCAAVIWLIIIAFYNFLSRYEEKLLLEQFGKDYEEYMEEVPMWIPRFIRK